SHRPLPGGTGPSQLSSTGAAADGSPKATAGDANRSWTASTPDTRPCGRKSSMRRGAPLLVAADAAPLASTTAASTPNAPAPFACLMPHLRNFGQKITPVSQHD